MTRSSATGGHSSGNSRKKFGGNYEISPIFSDGFAGTAVSIARLRAGGSSGGHNGLKDIERALGTSNYPRLRLGIDAPPPRVRSETSQISLLVE